MLFRKSNNKTVEELLYAAQKGNRPAINELCSMVRDVAYTSFATLFTDQNVVEEMAQELVVWFSQNLYKIEKVQGISAFLSTKVISISKNYLSKKYRRKFLSIEDELKFDCPANELILKITDEYEEKMRHEQDRELVNRGIQKLPPDYREIILLHYFQEYNYDQISRLLHISYDNAAKRGRRAVIILKKILESLSIFCFIY